MQWGVGDCLQQDGPQWIGAEGCGAPPAALSLGIRFSVLLVGNYFTYGGVGRMKQWVRYCHYNCIMILYVFWPCRLLISARDITKNLTPNLCLLEGMYWWNASLSFHNIRDSSMHRSLYCTKTGPNADVRLVRPLLILCKGSLRLAVAMWWNAGIDAELGRGLRKREWQRRELQTQDPCSSISLRQGFLN